MIHYSISSPIPTSQFLLIEINFKADVTGIIKLQMPAWRAGRYQIADYVKNVKNLSLKDSNGLSPKLTKTSKNTWEFKAEGHTKYTLSYDYYASKMDAGGCWVDEQQVYINFVNCCMELPGLGTEEISVGLNLEGYPERVCTLDKKEEYGFKARDFNELADSTFLAANQLTHWTYSEAGTNFNIWIHGAVHFDPEEFKSEFKKFTSSLIQDFGEFPEEEYHFIFQLLPYKHYHGVEHRKGTVITFGPAENLADEKNMEDLLGVSCHELYHAWNVCRIRPEELLPYNFAKETYTKAGWILEGITTYMGDLYLLKSGVYDLDTYLRHFSKVLQRESFIQGFQSQSILDSSFDLWIDGYEAGIPYRKTSIYTHGALIAFSIDLMLLQSGSSLTRVMKEAWEKFGKKHKGYTQTSFWELILNQSKDQEKFNEFYSDYIEGKGNIISFLKKVIRTIGLEIEEKRSSDELRVELGIILEKEKITKIHPDSPTIQDLMLGDQIKSESTKKEIILQVSRINGSSFKLYFPKKEANYFPELTFKKREDTALIDIWSK